MSDQELDLTVDEKKALLKGRIKQFNAEKFQHELNKKTAEAISNEEAVAVADESISVLEAAIATHLEELAKLD